MPRPMAVTWTWPRLAGAAAGAFLLAGLVTVAVVGGSGPDGTTTPGAPAPALPAVGAAIVPPGPVVAAVEDAVAPDSARAEPAPAARGRVEPTAGSGPDEGRGDDRRQDRSGRDGGPGKADRDDGGPGRAEGSDKDKSKNKSKNEDKGQGPGKDKGGRGE